MQPLTQLSRSLQPARIGGSMLLAVGLAIALAWAPMLAPAAADDKGQAADGGTPATAPEPASTPQAGAGSAPASDIGTRGVTFDPARSPFPPALHARVVEVIDHIYNFEFAAAEEQARAIRRSEPDDPIGSFLLSEAYFWQAVNNREAAELTDRFRDESRRVNELCEKRLKADAHDPTALFMLGGVSGRKAILDGLTGRRFESVNTAVKARQYLKLLNRYHPEQEDAYLGLGLYDYFASQLPWFARVLSKLVLGLGGDQAKGIAQLERAARNGLFTQVEARIFLSIAYLDTEGRYEEALAILKQLNNRYPRNLDFYGMLAFAYRTRHDYANAIAMLETLVQSAATEPAFGRQSRDMSAYFLASTYKVAGRFQDALPHLDRIIADPNPESEWLTAISLLERGRIHDAEGHRNLAVADYRQVLELKDFRRSRDNAKRYLSEPYVVSPEEASHHLPPSATSGSAVTAEDPLGTANGAAPPGTSNGKRP
jgi:tetratricopeptide (TPR) repeat protein